MSGNFVSEKDAMALWFAGLCCSTPIFAFSSFRSRYDITTHTYYVRFLHYYDNTIFDICEIRTKFRSNIYYENWPSDCMQIKKLEQEQKDDIDDEQ